jgi:hypothetical protein
MALAGRPLSCRSKLGCEGLKCVSKERVIPERLHSLRITESPLINRNHHPVTEVYAYVYHSPQEHFADKAILVYWLLVLALGNFGPHLHGSSVGSLQVMAQGRPL